MELTLWTYEGPPHVGAMRIATSMKGVHYVLHAPQGDTYADLLFTMIERRDARPPVTYTTFQARDLGGDTAELVKSAVRDAYERFKPDAMLVGESCTAELIQDQPGSLAMGMGLPIPIVPLELPAYSKKENWGASETFYHLVRTLLLPLAPAPGSPPRESVTAAATREHRKPRCNLLGGTALGFRNRDDVREVTRLLHDIGVDIHVCAPLNATVQDIQAMPHADFNIVLYPEVAETTARWLQKTFGQPTVRTVPIGVLATREFVEEVGKVAGVDVSALLERERAGTAQVGASRSLLPWYSRSVDSTYLTGKRVFVFGDATHVMAAARMAKDELGFTVVGIGTYSREYARPIRDLAASLGVEALISDDYLAVEQRVTELAPELVLGTQMERHIAKRLGVPCAVISAPIHVQDVPARHSPQMGFEGANVIFDTWVHPLMMGLEEHLLHMFKDDFEFADGATPSHLHASPAAGADDAPARGDTMGGQRSGRSLTPFSSRAALALEAPEAASAVGFAEEEDEDGTATIVAIMSTSWLAPAEAELKKIPFFVRGKARRNTEKYALEHGIAEITVDTLYDAKAYYGR
ncbi:MAG: ferredoxin:protochlorophyllide reductase (ATP-dependent) subunit B [Gemmatimonadota bacterium]|nr:ferredoxin:protochlorophyllide reductase (ATP-dependent) subunit B [Gemmatimonadota bacterium]MDQ8166656.1 ferredoxin:protochlorophyllide reductase (ATP-dependent) subunit B [Gemmatimonadota bacterium]MDQ8171945.1 ferredoxin:protochlorophyllide reductase (ATP-dependent) subunit B [Gemmatimonadota bacterium]